MPSKRKNPGKPLEILIASIERVLGHNGNVSVQAPANVPDRITGESREHDVLITITASHHKSFIAIECRDRSRKITVNDIEGFWSKCQDTGIDQGVLVSPKGFTKSAIIKATHRSIRCLTLTEATSFNWLLASGMTIQTRRVKHTNWTFFPEVDLVPPPATFTILTEDESPIDTSNLVSAAFNEFQKIPQNDADEKSGEKRIVFNSPGLLMRDDTTGAIYKVIKALAAVQYEVIEEFIPFRLVSYSNSPSGELITDAAVADLNIGGNKGKLMIVYKETEGGQVVFVPEKNDLV
jgi:hypothetical protein